MTNQAPSEAALAPTTIPPRRFHESLETVRLLADAFQMDDFKMAQQATMKSQLEWGMDMEWLDEAKLRWNFSDAQCLDFEIKFRERLRYTWADFAYEGD